MHIYRLFNHVPTLFGAVVALAMSGLAIAADADKEVSTAAEHAQYAASSQDITAVDMHLHHTINCLVGPDGAAFDAKQANPCSNLGNGAIPDSQSDEKTQALRKAVDEAQKGLATDDLKTAQQHAESVHDMLSGGM